MIRISYIGAVVGGVCGLIYLKDKRKMINDKLGNPKGTLATIGIPAVAGYIIPEFVEGLCNSGIVKVSLGTLAVAIVVDKLEMV